MGIIKLNKKGENKGTQQNNTAEKKENKKLSKAGEEIVVDEPAKEIELCELAKQDAGFVEELENLRTANETVYRRNDRTCRKIITAKPTRYLDENGKYRDISNRLTENGNEIENEANSFKVKFNKDATNGKIFDLQKGKKVVSLSAVNSVKTRSHSCGCKCELCSDKEDTVLATLDDGTKIEYVTQNDRIKENIIINEKRDKYEYYFTLNIGDLAVEEGDNNNLLLKDAQTGELQFTIPAPYMYDANKVRSNDVSYEIDVNGEELQIKVVANADFINSEERVLPVIIDPQIVIYEKEALSYYSEYYSPYNSENDISEGMMDIYDDGTSSEDIYCEINKNLINIEGVIEKVELIIVAKPNCVGYFKFAGATEKMIYPFEEKTYFLDITEKYINSGWKLEFVLSGDTNTYKNGTSQGSFYTSGENAPKLRITYLQNVDTTYTYNDFFTTTLSSGQTIDYGTSFALSKGDYFIVEVDYVGLINASGKQIADIDKCELCVWGRSRMAHCEYAIYSLTTNELVGAFSATHNLYYVDLKSLYNTYGNASFKFVAQWNGTEAVSLDNIDLKEIEKFLIGIEIAQQPTRLNYKIGDTFDSTGLVVNAVYSNGDRTEISNYSINAPSSLKLKDKYVEIVYGSYRIKQPIQVISQTLSFTGKLQSRTRTTYGAPWSEWEEVPPSCLYVGYTESSETRTVLTIKREKILLEENDKTGLRLQINCRNFPNANEPAKHIRVNGVRVKKDPMYNFVNAYIGDIKYEDTEDIQVIIEYDDYSFEFERFALFFCNECDPTTQVDRKTIETATGSINFNLSTGEAYYEFTDFDKEDSTLGCGISHILSPDNELNFYGRNYSLNICENLVLDSVNTNKRVKSHIFTDAYGIKHIFSILYYYIDNGKKVYIPQADYNNISSYMTFNGHNVLIEQMTINNQIYIDQPSAAVLNNSYYQSLLNKENNEMELPVCWLKAGDITKGFNAKGDLVLSIDEFNNYIAIEYNTNGSINRVFNNNGEYVNFAYNSNARLESLTNSRNKKVKYTYDTSYDWLETIEYCDLEEDNSLESVYKTIKLDYVSLKKNFTRSIGISQIETSDKYRTDITYDSSLFSSKISSIKNYSFTVSEEDNIELADLSSLMIEFDYINDKTTLTDDYGNKEIIIYEEGKRVVKHYSVTNGMVSSAKITDYVSFSTYTEKVAHPSTLNKYSFNNFVFQTGEETTFSLNAFNMPSSSYLENAYLNSGAYKNVSNVFTYDDNHKCIEIKTNEKYYNSTTGELIHHNVIVIDNIYNATTGKLIKQLTHRAHDGGAEKEKVDVIEYSYDRHGNQKKVIKYSLDWNNHSTQEDCNCSVTVATDKFYSQSMYDVNHNVVLVKDETGLYSEEYSYHPHSKCLNSLTNARNSTYYSYDSRDRLSRLDATDNGESNFNCVRYALGEVSELEHAGDSKIEMEYDAKRRVKTIKINEDILESYIYEDQVKVGNDTVDRVTKLNANNTSFKVEAARSGKYVKVYCDNVLQLTNKYNADGNLDEVIDAISNLTAKYLYDDYGNVLSFEEGNEIGNLQTERFVYNVRGLLEKVIYSGNVNRTECYTYSEDSEASLTGINFGTLKIKQTNDINGRLKNNYIYRGSNEISYESIIYRKENDHATFMPLKKSYKNYVSQTLTNTPQNPFLDINFVPTTESTIYSYDELGNIKTISQDGVLIAEYYYDSLNRLIREDNYQFNVAQFMQYDNNGNILLKKRCKLDAIDEVTYLLINSYNSDKLVSCNLGEFQYDSVGNPIIYFGKTATWSKGKLLANFNGNTFEYDGQKRRTKKNNIYYYYDSNNRLIKQSNGLEFYYKGSEVVGVRYKNVDYYYRKDMQGNIIAILDNTGKKVVVYSYDAWGMNAFKVSDNCSSDILALASLNPFRYRSYYYDTETGLYFLKTRYYDPEVGRFINMDSIDYADPEKINGLNLYAYCDNNPVMNVDPEGHFWFTFLTTIIGALVGAAVGAVDYLVNNDGDFSWVELVKKAGAGAAAGATAGFILGITKGAGIKAASYASAAVYSATSEIIDYATGTKELSLQNVGNSILKVAGDTAVNGTFNYITNYAAAKFIPTNASWFVPKKFVSYFTKTFGQRMIGQTLFAGSVANVITILWSEIKQLG